MAASVSVRNVIYHNAGSLGHFIEYFIAKTQIGAKNSSRAEIDAYLSVVERRFPQ